MNKYKDMTQGSPVRVILLFSLPLMIGNLFQQCYTVVDAMIVSRNVGVNALAAIGCCDWLTWLGFSIVSGFAQGFSILLSQSFGAKDHESCREYIYTTMINSVIVSLILCMIMFPSLKPILRLLGTPETLLPLSLSYVYIIYAGMPVSMFLNAVNCSLRALGNSKTPLYSMVISSVFNICADLLFVVVFHWGIKGAAVATVMAQVLGLSYSTYDLLKFKEIIPKKKYHNRETYLRMIRIAIPSASMNLLIACGGMILTGAVNQYGESFIAGFTAINKLYGLLEILAVSYGYAMVTYVGQNYGAHQYERIYQGIRQAFVLSLLSALFIDAILLIGGKTMIGSFVNTSQNERELIIQYGWNFLKNMIIALPILYLLHMYRNAIQGLGDTTIPMISGLFELLFRVTMALSLPLFLQEKGLYFVEPMAWFGAVLILIPGYYIHERKLRHENR